MNDHVHICVRNNTKVKIVIDVSIHQTPDTNGVMWKTILCIFLEMDKQIIENHEVYSYFWK